MLFFNSERTHITVLKITCGQCCKLAFLENLWLKLRSNNVLLWRPWKMEMHFILLNNHNNKLSSLWKHLESKAHNCSKLRLHSQSARCVILALKALQHILTDGDELAAPEPGTPWDQPCNIEKENLIFLNHGSPPLKIPDHRELSYNLFSSPT